MTVDDLIIDMGLALYISGEKQAIKVAKSSLKHLNSRQRKPVKAMLASNRVGAIIREAVKQHLKHLEESKAA